MRTWIYERGRWVEARYPFREDFDDLGEEIERQEALNFGSRHGSSASVRVYEAQEDIVTVEAVEGPVDVEFLVSVITPVSGVRGRPAQPRATDGRTSSNARQRA